MAEDPILEHYRREAERHAHAPTSTMADLTTRELEVEAILAWVGRAVSEASEEARILEVGCGNGYLLRALRDRFPAAALVGVDLSSDMLALARERSIPGCEIRREDVRSLPFPDASFDVVVSERCLINVPDEDGQARALREIHRVLRPGRHAILVEAFTGGLERLNRARAELGLPPNEIPPFNRWFDEAWFRERVEEGFAILDDPGLPSRTFLSSHYFVSRVLYPAVTRAEIRYNTEFVRFFRFLPPQGDYAPIQLSPLRRR